MKSKNLKIFLEFFEEMRITGNLTEIDKKLMENLDNDVEEFLENNEIENG